jgi:hypothetical protein
MSERLSTVLSRSTESVRERKCKWTAGEEL